MDNISIFMYRSLVPQRSDTDHEVYMSEPLRFYIRTDGLRCLLQDRHLLHRVAAARLGLTPNYWSQLVNRRRHLTPTVRGALLQLFCDVQEDDLWERVLVSAVDQAEP